MSEPVIRPWSYKCFQGCEDVAANHLDEIDLRSRHHHSVEPLYTRDDLVRVVMATLDYYSGVSGESAQDEAEETVDRLTKGGV